MWRNGGGRRLAIIEDSVDASIQRLEDYVKKNKEIPITATKISIDNINEDKGVPSWCNG